MKFFKKFFKLSLAVLTIGVGVASSAFTTKAHKVVSASVQKAFAQTYFWFSVTTGLGTGAFKTKATLATELKTFTESHASGVVARYGFTKEVSGTKEFTLYTK